MTLKYQPSITIYVLNLVGKIISMVGGKAELIIGEKIEDGIKVLSLQ